MYVYELLQGNVLANMIVAIDISHGGSIGPFDARAAWEGLDVQYEPSCQQVRKQVSLQLGSYNVYEMYDLFKHCLLILPFML